MNIFENKSDDQENSSQKLPDKVMAKKENQEKTILACYFTQTLK